MIRYGLNVRGSFPDRGKDFSLLISVQTGCGAHRSSYPMGIGGFFLESKAAGA
jgi:hypothetical protein